MNTFLIWISIGFLVLGMGCSSVELNQMERSLSSVDSSEPNTIPITFIESKQTTPLEAEVAQTADEKKEGLMFRNRLGENSGMLFVYPNEQQIQFWMKNTHISLDMIFVDAKKEIVTLIERVPSCDTPICPLYRASRPVQYVIETNAGYAEANGIKEGQSVLFEIPER